MPFSHSFLFRSSKILIFVEIIGYIMTVTFALSRPFSLSVRGEYLYVSYLVFSSIFSFVEYRNNHLY